tara:strand:+ start:175 stop:1392 length:1218 start_codon:yes stop_codon:yes gene_type:complete
MANLLDEASILLTPTAYNNGSMLAVKPENGDGDMTFSRNSAATRVNAQGLVENVAINLPRINYEGFSYDANGDIIPDSGCGSWLMEGQSTNVYSYSEPTVNEGTSGGITYDSFTWALGFTNCVQYGDNSVIRYRYGGTVSASTEYTLSTFVIMDDLSEPIIGGQTSDKDFAFVIGGGIYSNANASVNMGNNIWRVSVTATTSASPNTGNSGVIKFPSQSNKGFRVVGYQLEQNSYATSYIPTSGVSSTRLKDVANNSGNANLINSEEGVLYAEISSLVELVPFNSWLTITDGTSSNSVGIVFETTGTATGRLRVAGVVQAYLNATVDYSNFIKVAFKFKENDFSWWVNGIEVNTDSSGITFPLNTLNSLQFSHGAGSNNWVGKTKALAVFKTALTDAQLTLLTTI